MRLRGRFIELPSLLVDIEFVIAVMMKNMFSVRKSILLFLL